MLCYCFTIYFTKRGRQLVDYFFNVDCVPCLAVSSKYILDREYRLQFIGASKTGQQKKQAKNAEQIGRYDMKETYSLYLYKSM